jgi:hypothetical protein
MNKKGSKKHILTCNFVIQFFLDFLDATGAANLGLQFKLLQQTTTTTTTCSALSSCTNYY